MLRLLFFFQKDVLSVTPHHTTFQFEEKMTSKPFSFRAQLSSLSENNKTQNSSNTLNQYLNEIFHKEFMEKIKEWNNIHDKSCEHFSEYIQLVQLLNQQTPNATVEFDQQVTNNSSLMDISLTRKCKQFEKLLKMNLII